MKTLKKPVSILLSLMMIISMFTVIPATTAYADGTYTITVNSNKNDLVTVDRTTADENDKVHVTILDENYITDIQRLTVKDSSQTSVDYDWEEGGIFFTMPASNVTINVDFFNIITGYYSHGMVTASKTLAESGETVTLTACPNTNYKLTSLSVKKTTNEDTVQSFVIADNQTEYTFTMTEESPVRVEAEFSYVVPDSVRVGYISASGSLLFKDAIPLTGDEPWTYNYGADIHLSAGGWYVVQADLAYNKSDYSGFSPNLIADGTVNLILCDGATLSGIGDLASGTFNIYGQTNGTGSTSVNKLRNINLNLYGGILTVGCDGHGFDGVGAITVGGGSLNTTDQLSCSTLAVNGGAVTAPTIITVNITLNGGNLTLTGFDDQNESVRCFDSLIMTGGNLVIAGDILVNKKVSLGWTNSTDSVKIESVKFADKEHEGFFLTSVFTDGAKRYDVGEIGSGDISGKTLYPVPHHSITYITANEGSVTGPNIGLVGDTVALNVRPLDGYGLYTLSVTDANGAEIEYDDNYTFTMPDSDVTVTPTFGYTVTVDVNDDTLGSVKVLVNGEETNHAKVTDTVNIIVTPNTGCGVRQFLLTTFVLGVGNGVPIDYSYVSNDGTLTYTFTMPYSAGVKAEITLGYTEYNVTLPESTPHGTVEITGEYDNHYRYGDKIWLTLTPEEGYTVKSKTYQYAQGTSLITKQLQPTDTENLWYFDMPATHVTVDVTFAKASDVTINTTGNGTVTANLTKNVAQGSWVKLEVTPGERDISRSISYVVKSLTVTDENGNRIETTQSDYDVFSYYYFYMPDSNVNVDVTFAFKGRVLDASPATGGSWSCSKDFGVVEGETVTVAVTPNPGYKVSRVYYTNGDDTSVAVVDITERDESGNYTFTMPAYRPRVYVEFIQKDYAVNIGTDIVNGTVSADTPYADEGDVVTLTVTPAKDFAPVSVSVNGEAVVAVNGVYSFTMPADNVEVSAEFASAFTGESISLGGDIGVIFYLDPAVVRSGDTVSFFYDVNTNGTNSTVTKAYTLSNEDIKPVNYNGTQQYFGAPCYVNAAEMTSQITATVAVNGKEFTRTTSVKAYANKILNNDDYSDAHDIVTKMLDYGAKAQTKFNKNTDNLANAGLKNADGTEYVTDSSISSASITSTHSDMENGLDEYGLAYEGTSLLYLSRTTLRHYYTITDTNKTAESVIAEIEAANSGWTGGTKGSYIYFEMPNIGADDLATAHTLTINGKTYSFSALDYSKGVLEIVEANKGLTAYDAKLARATYTYAMAAIAYKNGGVQ